MYFRKTTYILRSPKRWDQLGKEADQDHSVGGRDHAVTIDVRGFLLLGRELHQIRQATREQHRVGEVTTPSPLRSPSRYSVSPHTVHTPF